MIKTIQEILLIGNAQINDRIETEILLSFVLEKPRAFLFAHPEQILSASQIEQFTKLIAARHQGIPIAYLLGEREFWSLPLMVNSATLIPRPETEMLVALTLQLLGSVDEAQILDLGTGAGGIALALAKEKTNWTIIATDFSEDALKVAQANAARLQLSNITFYHADWFSGIPESLKFDAILSNPPYISTEDPHINQGDLRFEPRSALVSGEDGLDAIRIIIEQSLARLKKNGLLLVEHGYDQKKALLTMLKTFGYQAIQSWQDYQGHDRVSGGKRIAFDE